MPALVVCKFPPLAEVDGETLCNLQSKVKQSGVQQGPSWNYLKMAIEPFWLWTFYPLVDCQLITDIPNI